MKDIDIDLNKNYTHIATVFRSITTQRFYYLNDLNMMLVTYVEMPMVEYTVEIEKDEIKEFVRSELNIGDEVVYHTI